MTLENISRWKHRWKVLKCSTYLFKGFPNAVQRAAFMANSPSVLNLKCKIFKIVRLTFFQELNTKHTWTCADRSLTALLNILLITVLILEGNVLKQRAADYCGLILFIPII